MKSSSFTILQTCFSPSWGGLEMEALNMTKRLQSRSHRMWLACLKGSRLEAEARSGGVSTLPLNVRGYFHPAIVWRLAQFLRQERVDIIHCQHSKDIATIVPAVLLARTNPPIILHKRVGSYISKKDLFHRFTYSHVDRVLAISGVVHRNVLDTTPAKPEQVITLFDAIDTDAFSLAQVDRDGVRRELGYTPETIVAGMVGRFTPGKGHEEFLSAAALLTKKHPAMRFVIVGEASFGEKAYETSIRTMCRQLGLEGVVHFTGFRKDVPAVMAGLDIFAFPSHAEAFGMVLIEAMAMERPIVSTNCDGVLDIVIDGTTGIHINPKKPDELASGIERLVLDPQLRQTMGRKGRERVLELFDRRKQTERIESLYDELIRLHKK